MQAADKKTRGLIELLERRASSTSQEESEVEQFAVFDDLLYRTYNGRRLLVVTKVMRKGIVVVAHDYGGHFSIDRTMLKITNDYWFANMQSYMR